MITNYIRKFIAFSVFCLPILQRSIRISHCLKQCCPFLSAYLRTYIAFIASTLSNLVRLRSDLILEDKKYDGGAGGGASTVNSPARWYRISHRKPSHKSRRSELMHCLGEASRTCCSISRIFISLLVQVGQSEPRHNVYWLSDPLKDLVNVHNSALAYLSPPPPPSQWRKKSSSCFEFWFAHFFSWPLEVSLWYASIGALFHDHR